MIDIDTPGWRVTLPVFEGPLDLLLYLIKNEEMDIYDVQLSQITQQYLDYLNAMRELDLEVAGEFLVVAATLVYIKSRTLLPVDQQPPEDEAEEDDPRWDLIRQLIEYKKFKEAAGNLEMRAERQDKIYHRAETPPVVVEATPQQSGLGKVTVLDLVNAFNKILERARQKQGFREIYEEKFTVGQKIELILDEIEKTGKLLFNQLFGDLSSRGEIVVTFLALLELIRLKQLDVRQSDAFSDIEITKKQNAPVHQSEDHGTEEYT